MTQLTNAFALDNQQKDVVVLTQAAPALHSWLLFIFSLFSMTFTYLTYRQGKTEQPISPGLRPSKLNTPLQVELHEALDTYFSEQELRELCFELGIDYEDLPFSGQGNKARELVAVCARLSRLHTLQKEIARKRPSLSTVSQHRVNTTPQQTGPIA